MLHTKEKAIELRTAGASLSEIAQSLKISKSTASLWVRRVKLSTSAEQKLLCKQNSSRVLGRRKLFAVREQNYAVLLNKVAGELQTLTFDKTLCKILCAFLYWGEGSKSGSFVSFINSDPEMIRTFLQLFRKSFAVDESKFRALVHLHNYHDEKYIQTFWSTVSKIPLNQFTKSFIKPNSSKYKKEGYKGCFRVRYYDVQIARELKALYNTTAQTIGV